MRGKSHAEQIERWAKYVRENPDKWKNKKLNETDGGKERSDY